MKWTVDFYIFISYIFSFLLWNWTSSRLLYLYVYSIMFFLHTYMCHISLNMYFIFYSVYIKFILLVWQTCKWKLWKLILVLNTYKICCFPLCWVKILLMHKWIFEQVSDVKAILLIFLLTVKSLLGWFWCDY